MRHAVSGKARPSASAFLFELSWLSTTVAHLHLATCLDLESPRSHSSGCNCVSGSRVDLQRCGWLQSGPPEEESNLRKGFFSAQADLLGRADMDRLWWREATGTMLPTSLSPLHLTHGSLLLQDSKLPALPGPSLECFLQSSSYRKAFPSWASKPSPPALQ